MFIFSFLGVCYFQLFSTWHSCHETGMWCVFVFLPFDRNYGFLDGGYFASYLIRINCWVNGQKKSLKISQKQSGLGMGFR